METVIERIACVVAQRLDHNWHGLPVERHTALRWERAWRAGATVRVKRKLIRAIVDRFEDISAHWLETGEGVMSTARLRAVHAHVRKMISLDEKAGNTRHRNYYSNLLKTPLDLLLPGHDNNAPLTIPMRPHAIHSGTSAGVPQWNDPGPMMEIIRYYDDGTDSGVKRIRRSEIAPQTLKQLDANERRADD